MNTKLKKLLCGVLALVMMLSMSSITAFAVEGEATGPVAKIGDTEYETLQAAVQAVEKGAGETTITLLADAKGGFMVGHSYVQNIVIDLDGYTISDTDIALTAYRAGTTLTLQNGTVKGNSYGGGTLRATNGGELILGDDLTVEAGGKATAIYVNGGKLTVTGKNVNVTTGTAIIRTNGDNNTISLAGGTYGEAPDSAWIAEGYEVVDNTDGTYTVKAVAGENVAQIGNDLYPSLKDAIAAAKTGDTITLIADISVAKGDEVFVDGYPTFFAVEGKTITIDLNGKNVTGDATGNEAYELFLGVFATNNGGYLTLVDENNEATVTVAAEDNTLIYSLIAVYNPGCGITIKGGNYYAPRVHDCLLYSSADEALVVEDGVFKLDNVGQGDYEGEGDENGKPWIFNVYGGNDGASIVKGGTFNADVSKQHWVYEVRISEDLICNDNGDGTWSVVPAPEQTTNVAMIDDDAYPSLAAALEAAEPGATIKLIADIKLDAMMVLNKDITLDLNGCVITAEAVDGYSDVFRVVNAKVVVTDSSTEKAGAVDASPTGYAFFVGDDDNTSGELIVKAGKFYGDTTAIQVTYGKLIIEGGYFEATEYEGAHEFTINCKDTPYREGNAEVVISGGTFYKFNPVDNVAENPKANYCADGYCAKAEGDTYVVVAHNHVGVYTDPTFEADGFTTYTCEHCGDSYTVTDEDTQKNAVAEVNGNKYESFAEAFEAANDGDTITLLANITAAGVVINKSVTIDFGGFTYTLTDGVGSTGTESNGFQILKDNKVTLKNGTLTVAAEAADKLYILIQNYADLTITDMILDGTNLDKWVDQYGDSYVVSNNCGNVVINGKTIITANNDGDLAYAFDAYDSSKNGYSLPTVTVADSVTFSGKIDAAAKVGNTYYATFDQAWAALKADDTITLLADVTAAGRVINMNVTIDLNGHTYTVNQCVGSTGTETLGFQLLKGNNVTFKNGTLAATATVAGKPVKVLVMNYTDSLTLENVTLDGTGSDAMIYVLSNNSGKVVIDANSAVIAPEGAWAFDVYDYSSAGYTNLPSVTVEEGAEIVGKVEAAAKIGNAYYAALPQAIAAAKDGDTVTLLADVTVAAEIATIKSSGVQAYTAIKIPAGVTVDGNDKTLTVTHENVQTWNSAVYMTGGTLKNLTIVGGNRGVLVNCPTADITLENVSVSNSTYALNTNSKGPNGTVKLTVKNCTFNGWTSVSNVSISEATFENCAFGMSNRGEGKTDYAYFRPYCPTTISGANTTFSEGFKIDGTLATITVAEGVDVSNIALEVNTVMDANADGTKTIRKANYVAEVNGEKYESFDEAWAALEANGTITLLADVTAAGRVINMDVTIDLNSFTYTVNKCVGSSGTETLGFQLLKGNVTIMNGTIKAAVEVVEGKPVKMLVNNYTNLTLKGVTLDGRDSTAMQYVLSNNSGDTLIDANSAVIAPEGAVAFDVYDYSSAGYTLPTVTVEEGAKIVGKVDALAKIGNTYYAYNSLQDVIDAAKDGDTVVLNKDINLDADDIQKVAGYKVFFAIQNKAITLDLNGCTITADNNGSALVVAIILVDSSASLTVTDSTEEMGGGIAAPRVDQLQNKQWDIAYMFWKRGTTGYLNIEGGKFFMNNAEDSMVYTNGSDIVNVTGGTFVLEATGTRANGHPWIFNAQGRSERHVNVSGGVFNTNIFNQYWRFEVQLPENEAGDVEDKDFYTVEYNKESGLYTVVPAKVAAFEKIGNYYYPCGYNTLAEAIANYESKDLPIRLLDDITGAGVVIDKDVVIDFNGKTYTVNKCVGSAGTETLGFQLLKGNNVTFKNGTIKAAAVEDVVSEKPVKMLVMNYANLTLEGVTLDGRDSTAMLYVLSNNSGDTLIDANSKVIAPETAVAFDVYDYSSAGYTLPTVTVEEGAKIVGDIEAVAKIGNTYYAK